MRVPVTNDPDGVTSRSTFRRCASFVLSGKDPGDLARRRSGKDRYHRSQYGWVDWSLLSEEVWWASICKEVHHTRNTSWWDVGCAARYRNTWNHLTFHVATRPQQLLFAGAARRSIASRCRIPHHRRVTRHHLPTRALQT